MMIEASWVTIRHRMCIIADGAGAEVDEDGSPEVVAEPDLPAFREGLLPSPEGSSLTFPWFEPGVEPALSSAATGASVIVTSADAGFEAGGVALAGASSEVGAVPVLTRL